MCVCQYFCLHVTVSQGNISLEKCNGNSVLHYFNHVNRDTQVFFFSDSLNCILVNWYLVFISHGKAFGCV